MITGLNANTPVRMQLNEGMFLKSAYTGVKETDVANIVSATRGGATISIVPTIRQLKVDGARANTLELTRIDEYVVTASMTIVELTTTTTKMAMGSADISSNTVTPRHIVKASDFTTLYWVGELADGKKVQIKFNNAYNTNGLNFTTTEKGEGAYALNLVAHYSVDDLDTVPVEVKFLGNSAVVTFTKTPSDLTLVVKDADGQTVEVENDGTYILTIGSYTYTASATDYITETDTALVIDNADAVVGTKAVTITLVLAGEQ